MPLHPVHVILDEELELEELEELEELDELLEGLVAYPPPGIGILLSFCIAVS